ncbi:MAG: hypothetical protein ACRDVN_15620 [Jiangellaceae bacterium]
MTVIAILLLALVIVLIVAAVTGSSDTVTVDAFNVSVDTNVAEVFLAGVLTGLLAVAALVLLRVGMRRARLRRQEVRELRRRADAAPAASDTATSGTREAPDAPEAADAHETADTSATSAEAGDAATGRPASATDQRETSPPGDATDPTTEPHRP